MINSNMIPALMVKSELLHSIACMRLQHTSVLKSITAVCLMTQIVLHRFGVSRPSFDSVTQPLRVFPTMLSIHLCRRLKFFLYGLKLRRRDRECYLKRLNRHLNKQCAHSVIVRIFLSRPHDEPN